MEGTLHTIATYNMSFMSDLQIEIGPKMAFASESVFLARLRGDADRRKYWISAMNLLKDFLRDKEPSVVGLQEMNLTDEGSNTGTDAINQMLVGTGYKQISNSVPTNNAGLSIIYNPEKVGEVMHSLCIDNVNQGGRPLLMIVTQLNDKIYLSVSIHGAQDPKLRLDKDAFNAYMMEKNKEFLQSKAEEFLNSKKFLNSKNIPIKELAGVFIMGDFNDRYDAITEIKIGDKIASYSGTAPKSCCHNWDSSCPDDLVENDFGGGYKTCKEPAVELMKSAELGKLALPGDRGAVKNYKYAGDKVFGLNPKSHMEMYRPEMYRPAVNNVNKWDGNSRESDHELVYASFGEGAAGGARKTKARGKANAKAKAKARATARAKARRGVRNSRKSRK